jgi:hypothetical protein
VRFSNKVEREVTGRVLRIREAREVPQSAAALNNCPPGGTMLRSTQVRDPATILAVLSSWETRA